MHAPPTPRAWPSCARWGLLAALAACVASAHALGWREQDGIGWACGGIGVEERQALKVMESKASAVLLFVAGTRGTLTADTHLRIVSATDATLGLDIAADGPICVIKLPAGHWKIEARHGQTLRIQDVVLKAQDSAAPRRIQFAFPEESTGSPRASPEESSGVNDWGRVGR